MPETLKDRIKRHIEISGPLPLAEFMHWCMADRHGGYYIANNPIGREGDFITAPEVSQMFGELIGIWTLQTWKQIGSPKRFNLVEMGPGRGYLMRDLLRATKVSEPFQDAVETILVETSAQLIKEQSVTLSGLPEIKWLGSINELPELPTIVIANEFLDVLPIRQYVKSGNNWCENCIGIDKEGNLTWVLGSGSIHQQFLPNGHETEPEGAVFETSTVRESFIGELADFIGDVSGAALFIDYGHLEPGFGDTFQALQDHTYVNPLSNPGHCDLTSHVDFAALVRCLENTNLEVHPAVTQGEFLLSMGLLERAGSLGMGKSETVQANLKSEAERLALPDQMGNLFKVMAFSTCAELEPFSNQA
ncbi:MAG: class I SAM-dependent methyltransferase [Rhizobiaceae bacterium]